MRAAAKEDVEFVWDASRYDGFNDGMAWDPPENINELVAVANKNIEQWKKGTSFTFHVESLETDNSIGRVAIRATEEPFTWNIGYWVHPKYWNSGYATEAAKAVMEFGVNELEATKIVTAHAVWNESSAKVIKKLGFKVIGRNPNGFIKKGKPIEEITYEFKV